MFILIIKEAKMKKITITILTMLITLIQFSQSGYGKTHPQFFWELSQKKSKIFLLGSIHVAKKDIYPLSKKVYQAFDSSNYLVVEVNIKS